ncbi:MAG TPA: histidine kinase [Gemmatimonadaceae bacterium]
MRDDNSATPQVDGVGVIIPRWRAWIIVSGAATAIGLVFASQHYVYLRVSGARMPFAELAALHLIRWFLWAALAPFIFAAARRWRLDEGDVARRLALQVVCAVAFAFAHALLATLIERRIGFGAVPLALTITSHVLTRFTGDVFVYLSIVAAWHALEYYGRYRSREARTVQLEARLASTRLQVLRMQLNPHFLFNTLNTVSALMRRDVEAADAMLTSLSDLLRLALRSDDVQEVPLRQEIEFVRRYLDIMRIRYGDRIRTDVRADPDVLDALVPNLVLQPLVENALRHGVSMRPGGGCVQVRAERRESSLRLTVADDGPGLPAGWTPGASLGVGLRNTRDRLAELYGDRYDLAMRNRPEGGLELTVVLPYRVAVLAAGA